MPCVPQVAWRWLPFISENYYKSPVQSQGPANQGAEIVHATRHNSWASQVPIIVAVCLMLGLAIYAVFVSTTAIGGTL